jgi:hypothetical protein
MPENRWTIAKTAAFCAFSSFRFARRQ